MQSKRFGVGQVDTNEQRLDNTPHLSVRIAEVTDRVTVRGVAAVFAQRRSCVSLNPVRSDLI
jgi:hypothetical protein